MVLLCYNVERALINILVLYQNALHVDSDAV